MSKSHKATIDVVTKSQADRFELLVTLGYIVGCLSRSEAAWLRRILTANWVDRPNPNTGDTNYGR